MDDVEITAVREEHLLASYVRVRKPTGPKANGKCLWCEEPMANTEQRWCDAGCRDDYATAEKNAPHLIP